MHYQIILGHRVWSTDLLLFPATEGSSPFSLSGLRPLVLLVLALVARELMRPPEWSPLLSEPGRVRPRRRAVAGSMPSPPPGVLLIARSLHSEVQSGRGYGTGYTGNHIRVSVGYKNA